MNIDVHSALGHATHTTRSTTEVIRTSPFQRSGLIPGSWCIIQNK